MHDKTKVVLGSTQKSFRHVDNEKGVIPAGKIVRLKSDGTLSLAAADGLPLGISCGKMLGNAARTNIVRAGTAVPLLLTAAFTPVKGAQVNISDTTGLGIAAGAGATGMNAVYRANSDGTVLLTGILEDGTEAPCALIDMQGGL